MWASAVVACVVVVSAGLLRRWPLLALALLVVIPVVASTMDAMRLGLGLLVLFYAEARNALTAIEATSRETLAGLRQMLGVLRRAEPGSPGRPGPGHGPLASAPGLADCRHDELGIEVTRRRARQRATCRRTGRGRCDRGRGFGIDGMRERACLLGGELTAGPRAGGGFRVAARLPVPAAAH